MSHVDEIREMMKSIMDDKPGCPACGCTEFKRYMNIVGRWQKCTACGFTEAICTQ